MIGRHHASKGAETHQKSLSVEAAVSDTSRVRMRDCSSFLYSRIIHFPVDNQLAAPEFNFFNLH
jgi:hypothetical protein